MILSNIRILAILVAFTVGFAYLAASDGSDGATYYPYVAAGDADEYYYSVAASQTTNSFTYVVPDAWSSLSCQTTYHSGTLPSNLSSCSVLHYADNLNVSTSGQSYPTGSYSNIIPTNARMLVLDDVYDFFYYCNSSTSTTVFPFSAFKSTSNTSMTHYFDSIIFNNGISSHYFVNGSTTVQGKPSQLLCNSLSRVSYVELHGSCSFSTTVLSSMVDYYLEVLYLGSDATGNCIVSNFLTPNISDRSSSSYHSKHVTVYVHPDCELLSSVRSAVEASSYATLIVGSPYSEGSTVLYDGGETALDASKLFFYRPSSKMDLPSGIASLTSHVLGAYSTLTFDNASDYQLLTDGGSNQFYRCTAVFHRLNGQSDLVFESLVDGSGTGFGDPIDVPDPQRDGFTFAGWFSDCNFSTQSPSAFIVSDWQEHWALWDVFVDLPVCTVLFDLDGGFGTIQSEKVLQGSLAIRPSDPTKYGVVFDHWALGGERFDFGVLITNDITLKAVYSSTGSPISESSSVITTVDGARADRNFSYVLAILGLAAVYYFFVAGRGDRRR